MINTIKQIKEIGCLNCNSKDFTNINKGEWGISCRNCGANYYWQKFADEDYRLIREHFYSTAIVVADPSKWNLERSDRF